MGKPATWGAIETRELVEALGPVSRLPIMSRGIGTFREPGRLMYLELTQMEFAQILEFLKEHRSEAPVASDRSEYCA